MTGLEKAFEKMTPDQRKKNVDAISEMMGMPVKKNNSIYKKDQVKCPYCGSKNTAQILYGNPAGT